MVTANLLCEFIFTAVIKWTLSRVVRRVLCCVDPCISVPCLHSGTCIRVSAVLYNCICSWPYSDSNCQTGLSLVMIEYMIFALFIGHLHRKR